MDVESSGHDKLESTLQDPSSEPCNLSLEYLRKVTNDFSDERLLGEGGFGKVYKGVLQSGKLVAVKKLEQLKPGIQEKQFENEVYHLMRLKHPNIVRFLGYCYETQNECINLSGTKYIFAEKQQRLLCLEYLSNGSLDGHLSDESSGLDWETRYKIIKGICCAIHYLHEGCQSQINGSIIHLDLKPANILLDDNMVPKVADFGLSRLFDEKKSQTWTTNLAGSFGYMAPEYIYKHVITTKADIYSLGVIIIEIIMGDRIDPFSFDITSCQDFMENVLESWRNRLNEATSETDCEQINCCLEVGLSCLKVDRNERPTSGEIIKMLRWESTNCYANNFDRPPEGDPVPGVKDLQIVGEPRPGFTLRACGFPTNGTSTCNFQWIRCLENDIDQDIEGARFYDYTVTADDVGILLAVDCEPLDDNGHKGNWVREFANNKNKITCDPKTQDEIDLFIMTGRADFDVYLRKEHPIEEWKLATLVLRRTTVKIKCKYTCEVVLDEKYSPNLQVKLPLGFTSHFSLVNSTGVNLFFKTEGITEPNNEHNDVRLRDLIVMSIRTFQIKGLSGDDALDVSEVGEVQNIGEPSTLWDSEGSPDLASNHQDLDLSYPQLPAILEEPGSSSSYNYSLPGLNGLRIAGLAFPGQELQASGYSINGTVGCNFKWVRQLDDGSVNFIEEATDPSYLVTADDVDTLLAVEVVPLDSRERKGDCQKVYANEQRKITCDPETKELIKKTLEIGHVIYEVEVQMPQARNFHLWEPAVLVTTREGYSIKRNGQRGVMITEKFQQATTINIPYGSPTEFSIISAEGIHYDLKPAENTVPRDTIVLVIRLFRLMAFGGEKKE